MIKLVLLFTMIFIAIFQVGAKEEERFLKMPDGNSVRAKPGQTVEETWFQAMRKFPKSFGVYVIPEDKIMDVDWFNDCRAKAVKNANNDSAVFQIVKACQHQAVPKKCRKYSIGNDYLGNQTAEARIKCVEECSSAGVLPKRVGECSKG